jgi:hypothetical protein
MSLGQDVANIDIKVTLVTSCSFTSAVMDGKRSYFEVHKLRHIEF